MKFLEGKFFKNWCIFLGEEDNRYFVLYGKIEQITIEARTDYNSRTLNNENTASISIPFINKNDKLYTIINIYNKEEYYSMIEILEDIL